MGGQRSVAAATRLAGQLEARRQQYGWSVAYLATRAGYHENTVLRVLHGRNVRLQTLQDVAAALGLCLSLTRPAA
jgi:transcriptional regulator with XRE-family HTH domain